MARFSRFSPCAALFLILLLASCGDSTTAPGDDPTDDPDDDPDTPVVEDPAPDPTAGTFCGRLGFVCTADEVPDEVFERSEALLVDVKERSEGGEGNEALAAWLRDQDGVVAADASDGAVVFRVAGGQPTWFLTPAFDAAAALEAAVPDPASQDVVGHGTPRENPENRKKALVLAPFLFEFGADDPAPEIRSLLLSATDYSHADGVRYVANTTAPGLPTGNEGIGQPTVEDFKGWDAYDVIAVAAHGSEMTEGSFGCAFFLEGALFCMAGVSTGERIRSCGVIKARYPGLPGIRCAGTANVEGSFFLVDTDFFAWEYGAEFEAGLNQSAGLDKAIIYMGACASMKNGALAWQLGGDDSEYFGWDASVYISQMKAPAVRLFQLLVTDGLSTEDAYDDLTDEGGHVTTAAVLRHASNDDGLHIREITTLKNPMSPASGSGFALADALLPIARQAADEDDLQDGDVLPFLGQAGDGESDRLLFDVEVEGVPTGREGDYEITVEVNGTEMGTWALDGPHSRRIDHTTMRIRIIQPVDFDVQDDQTIALKATTNLPGDGESPAEVTPRLANPVLHIHSILESSAEGVGFTSEVEGEIALFFEEGATAEELTMGESEGTLEYVAFEVAFPGLPGGCSVTTTTTDGRLGIKDGQVTFGDPDDGDFGVPEELLLIVYPEISERYTFQCPTGGQSFNLIHWFAGFVSYHGGQLNGPNEFDDSRGGFVLRDWQPGSDGVYARKTYDRTGEEDGVTLREETRLEIRGPAYGGS